MDSCRKEGTEFHSPEEQQEKLMVCQVFKENKPA